MPSCRPVTGFAFVAALTAASGWLCAQEQNPFAGAKPVEVPVNQAAEAEVAATPAAEKPAADTAEAPAATRPSWVEETLTPSAKAKVARVVPGVADVVVLDGGAYQGLRNGVICRIDRGNDEIGEVIIVATQADRSAGLITGLMQNITIQAGDTARLKKLQLP